MPASSPSRLARSRKGRAAPDVLCERVYRPVAHLVVLALLPLRVPPPAVVLAAAATGVLGAVELARGQLVAAALLIQLKTVLDNADGQLARLSGRITLLGRYLDSECDLLVDAALFAALGWYAGAPVAALAGFVALTAVLSLNFNLERLYRGAALDRPEAPGADSGRGDMVPEPAPDASDSEGLRPLGLTAFLQRVYALTYGWQDVLVERVVDRRLRDAPSDAHAVYHDRFTVSVLANMGMTPQLAAFGICIAAGRPLLFVWIVLAELAAVALLCIRRDLRVRGVQLEGQPGGIA